MNDKELLELAAKAVNGGAWHPLTHSNPWNPLTDDGDALRLAVKLKMSVIVDFNGDDVARAECYSTRTGGIAVHEDDDGDPYAATRLAIVRAAAEIGKEMP